MKKTKDERATSLLQNVQTLCLFIHAEPRASVIEHAQWRLLQLKQHPQVQLLKRLWLESGSCSIVLARSCLEKV